LLLLRMANTITRSAGSFYGKAMTVKCTASHEQGALGLATCIGCTAGYGLGAFACMHGTDGSGFLVLLYASVGLSLLLALGIHMCVPEDPYRSSDEDVWQSLPVGADTHRNITLLCVALTVLSAYTVASLQTASATIAQVSIGLDSQSVLAVLSAALLVAVAILCVYFYATASTNTVFKSYLIIAALTVSVLSFLPVFLVISSLAFGSSGTWASLIFSDAIGFSHGCVVAGFADGIMMEYAMPGTLMSKENLVALTIALQGLAQAFGPAVARFLVDANGQTLYAAHQLIPLLAMLTAAVSLQQQVKGLSQRDGEAIKRQIVIQ